MHRRNVLTALASLFILLGCWRVVTWPGPVSAATTPSACTTVKPVSVRPIRIMPLGDSLTAGYNSTDGNGWRGRLAPLMGTYGVKYVYVGQLVSGTLSYPHEGYGGSDIQSLAEPLPGWLSTDRPDVVLFSAGINDVAQGKTADHMLAWTGRVIDETLAYWPSTRIVVGQENIALNHSAALQAVQQNYNDRLLALVANKGSRVRLANLQGVAATDRPDGTHPNDTGYTYMASQWKSGAGDWLPSA
jgi:lysophospholipase L1-like esterase